MATPQLLPFQPLAFGTLLRRWRLAAGLTQEGLAERAQLSARSISDLERGLRRAPYRKTVLLLSAALHLDAHERKQLLVAAGRVPVARREPPPTPPPDRAPPLVGRARELALLERHLAGEGGPLLLLAGEPGIGKSRLLHETAIHARERGWRVLAGGCQRRSGQEPYAPLVDALARQIEEQPSTHAPETLQGCAWLVRLIPELAELPHMPQTQWMAPPEQERRLMFAAVAHFLTNLASSGGARGALLVLDDLQWAGTDALALLASLLSATVAGEALVRVVGSYRTTEVRAGDPLAELLGDLAREGWVEQIEVGPLAPDEATALATTLWPAASGEASGDMVTQLVQRTGGVPFFLVSCMQELASSPNTATDGGLGETVPWTVAQSIRQRVAALPTPARQLLRVAAIAGRDVSLALLLAVARHSGRHEEVVLTALEATNHAQLLVEMAGMDRYQFSHDLVREGVSDDIGSARRAVIHRQIAEALEEEPGPPPVDALAYHYRCSDAREQAVTYLELAGDQSAARHANTEAEGSYRELVARLDALGRPTQAAREKLGGVLSLVARHEEAMRLLEQAAEGYRAAGDREGQRRCLAQVGREHMALGRPLEGITRLRLVADQLSESAPTPAVAAIQAALSILYFASGQYREQLEAAERAEAQAQALEDSPLLVDALHWHSLGLMMLGRTSEALEVVERLFPLAEAVGDLSVLAWALSNVHYLYWSRGERERNRAHLARALEVAKQLGDPGLIAHMIMERGQCAFEAGEWDEADACCQQTAQLTQHLQWWGAKYLVIFRGILWLAQRPGDVAVRQLESGAALDEQEPDLQASRYAQSALAEWDLLRGSPDRARARLLPLLDRSSEHESDVTRYVLPVLAWAHLESGDETRAEAVVLQSVIRAQAEPNQLALADSLRVQGLVATRQGRWQAAEAALEEALILCRTLPYPYAEAKALYVYGQMRQAKGEPEGARERYEQARAICDRLGEGFYRPHIDRALAALG